MNTKSEHPAQPSQAIHQVVTSLETNGFTFRYLKPLAGHATQVFRAHYASPTPTGLRVFSVVIDIEGNIITNH
jgi:hypothetical protein